MHTPILAFGLGWPEMLIIVLVLLLLFGAKRLPDLAKSIGKSITEFKKGAQDVHQEIERAANEPPPPSSSDNKTKPPAA